MSENTQDIMLKLASLLFLLFSVSITFGQNWNWTELDTMPFRTANNAVCEANVNGEEYVYSFGGIDTSKIYSGIHKRCFRYHVSTGQWIEIDTLPDPEAKIASAASYVKGKIYIIGGYHVYPNHSEVSSDRVHIYNPATNLFEPDGAPIPRAIDDQVQCVYRDSLIYVITGWSNTTNYPNVQIYDPTLNQWEDGTYVPNFSMYTAFGASGYIVGDTIYYYGGASGGSFGARKYMRRGIINPNDPTDITWELMGDAPGDAGYRSACSGTDDLVFWVGGSPTSYNYDGIAYNGTGGVDPSARILHFNPSDSMYVDEVNQPYGVMDLRGIAKLSNNRWIICGGMDTNQVVSNRTFLLESSSLALSDVKKDQFEVIYSDSEVRINSKKNEEASLIDNSGKIISRFELNDCFILRRERFRTGVYFFRQGENQIRIQL